MAASQTWKEYAGRLDGRDGYQFGDFLRHFVHKFKNEPTSDSTVDDGDRALLDLKVQRDQLCGHRRRVEKQLAHDEEAARSFVSNGKKSQAMLALRKKKQHQQLLIDCEQHIGRVEELIDNIELARTQQMVVETLSAGVVTLKRLQKEIGGVDYVQQLMDDRVDVVEAQEEINNALAEVGVGVDDADALAELARLEEAHAQATLEVTASIPTIPPTGLSLPQESTAMEIPQPVPALILVNPPVAA